MDCLSSEMRVKSITLTVGFFRRYRLRNTIKQRNGDQLILMRIWELFISGFVKSRIILRRLEIRLYENLNICKNSFCVTFIY
ncbi:MAG: hypothetical protein CM15mP58_04070 [Burkholderiaceae bacterium]|nr:MAG: hypothetical protein CM15mP58_04070 [Burkholderiaceae bacterium]